MLDRRSFVAAAAAGVFAPTLPTWGQVSVAKGLRLLTETPLNAEPPLRELVASWQTPNELFYVRSHAPAPNIDARTFQLSVEGMVRRPFSVSLEQLQRQFEKRSTVATLTCAGNRRNEHSLVRPIDGVPWGPGAIGNAQWGGALLADLLREAGVLEGARHVWFEGVDQIERDGGVIPFGASIPLEKALADDSPAHGAMVAYEMNGQPLSADHGFPMRTVVPGFIGARSVKWLGKIVVSDRPSPNHYVAGAYKLVPDGSADAMAAAQPLGPFVVNSVIAVPDARANVSSGKLRVRGYALPSGDAARTIRRVEVSTDDGGQWTEARLTDRTAPFCWQLWDAAVQVDPSVNRLTVRATDSAGHTQPQTVAWNYKGYMFNAWHQTPIRVQ